MKLTGIKIGFCVTGSFCTLHKVLPQIEEMVNEGAQLYPIFSYSVANTDTRFTTATEFRKTVERLTHNTVIDTIVDAEPIGPQHLLDVIVVAPCTGNTLAKLANGITDTPVLMAVKAHLRNQKPVVIAISTNDGLGNNGKNLAMLLNMKNIYIVPYYQDGPHIKSNSLMADMNKIIDTVILALDKKQIQPVLLNIP
ncbi:MAG TPA: dipicolinate synthase subunit B [Clostridiales bacterium]|nr:dipicolinate synthase subunit B [Clostridiales bacterium]